MQTQTPTETQKMVYRTEILDRAGGRVLKRVVRGSYVDVVERPMLGMAYGMTLMGDWLVVWMEEEDGRVTILRTVTGVSGEVLLNVKTLRDFEELFFRYAGHDR